MPNFGAAVYEPPQAVQAFPLRVVQELSCEFEISDS